MVPFHTDIVSKELETSLKRKQGSSLFDKNEVGKLGNNFAQFCSWSLQISQHGQQKLLDGAYFNMPLALDWIVWCMVRYSLRNEAQDSLRSL